MVGPDSAPGSQPLGLWSSPATRTADSILAQPCPPPSFWRSPWPRGPPPQHPGSPPCPPLARPTPPPRASLPQPSTPARCLPPSPPPVSPSPALTWEVRGVGARMTHSVMMQSHNTQLHSPTDRGTGGRPPLAAPRPPQLGQLGSPGLEPLTTTLPAPRPQPLPH